MAAVSESATLWTYRRIPYVFEQDYPHRKEVRDAMDQWERAAGVTFQERAAEENYLVIENPASGSSSSALGMRGGRQEVFIDAGYKALHELGHALGLIHEQCRSDRDEYVEILWDNIEGGTSNGNFTRDQTSINATDYDLTSVMHYPAPATGWGGTPSDCEVWTMRWKADPSVRLGAGNHQGWSNLSNLDRATTGIKALYEKIPVPMGPETAHGTWNNPYACQFQFDSRGRHFLYGQNHHNNYWFIQELLPDGRIGQETDNGKWNHFYQVQFAYSIDARVFFYGQDMNEKHWFIQELLPGGQMGAETAHGTWKFAYESQGSFAVGGKVYVYGQNLNERNWFIQEVLPDGTMGVETAHGTWKFGYETLIPLTAGSRTFLYGQNQVERNWFIQEILPGGVFGAETAHGTWANAYPCQFTYRIADHTYLYGQDLESKYWFIQRINPDGTMGDEIQSGFWHFPYAVQVPFQVNGEQYFYGQNLNDLNWFVQRLIDVE